MPATSVRCSVPTSIVSFTSFVEFGTFSAVSTFATRRSTFMKSSIEIRSLPRRPAPRRGCAPVPRPAPRLPASCGGCRCRLRCRRLLRSVLVVGHRPQLLHGVLHSWKQRLDATRGAARRSACRPSDPTHVSAVDPSIVRIRSAVVGITGSISAATTRSASAALYSVASSSGRDSGVFASAHGSRVTMYLFSARNQLPRSRAAPG